MNHSTLARAFLGGFSIFALACHHPAALAPAPDAAARAPQVLVLGPLRLTLGVSARASTFWAVDQLSAWSPSHHAVYQELLKTPPPSSQETAALSAQRTLRARLPSGSGLEAAYGLGRNDGLNASEREEEDRILATFEPRLRPFLAQQLPHVEHFARHAEETAPRLAPLLGRLGQMLESPMLDVPVVLVARPGRGGGGGSSVGGVLVVEVTADEESLTPLVRESVHRLLGAQRTRLRASARACASGGADGFDEEHLEEGLARALAPGLVHDGPADEDVLARLAHGKGGEQDPAYAFALAVRPAVQSALRGEGVTWDQLFAQLCAAWKQGRGTRGAERMASNACPCGSGERYRACCAVYHAGHALPPTPTALVRARFAAFALRELDFLVRTFDPEHPEGQLDPEALKRDLRASAQRFKYVRLHVLGASPPDGDGARGEEAWVEFKVDVFEQGKARGFGERSYFRHHPEKGWRYVRGELR